MQRVCSPSCALAIVRENKGKKARADNRKAKERLKTRSDWMREAQTAVNWYIRERDRGRPCISCDKPDNGQHQRHASHYRSVGACSSLRFNAWNIHASCATCNAVLSGNLIEYRIRLIRKVGQDRVDWLESQNALVKYDIEYLKRMKRIFNKRARRLKRLNGG